MRVDIEMVGDLYTAVVTTQDGETYWTTSEPMDESSLGNALYKLRIDYREVSHAFANADLRIAQEQRQALERYMSDTYGPERGKELLEKVDEKFKLQMEAAKRGRR